MTPSTPWHPPPGLTLCNPPMTDQQHLITPPPELVEQWVAEIWHEGTPCLVAASDLHIANQAARWGAAATLRAAADQVVPPPLGDGLYDCCAGIVEEVRSELLAIAAELEGAG